MGYALYRMIRDGAPAGWTPQMRLVALAIADDARDPADDITASTGPPWSRIPIAGHTDKRGRWRDGLAERTGLSEKVVSRALTSLARAGYEMRSPIGTDKAGRPVFAARGHAVSFVVPSLLPRAEPGRAAGQSESRSDLTAFEPGSRSDLTTFEPERWSDLTTPSTQRSIPSEKKSPHAGWRQPVMLGVVPDSGTGRHPPWLAAALPGMDDDEIDGVQELIRAEFGARTMSYIRVMAANGDLARYLTCDHADPGRRSAACRARDGDSCAAAWCGCRCHRLTAGSNVSATARYPEGTAVMRLTKGPGRGGSRAAAGTGSHHSALTEG